MPIRDREERLASQRRSYARNREKVIAEVAQRRHTVYAGVCRNCGGPTVGYSKNDRPEWCAKPDCASIQRQIVWQERRDVVSWKHHLSLARRKGKWKGFCSCGWQSKTMASSESVHDVYRQHTNLVERSNLRPDAK